MAVGEEIQVVGPDTRPFAMQVPVLKNETGQLLSEARTPQMRVQLQLPQQVPAYSILRRAVDLSG